MPALPVPVASAAAKFAPAGVQSFNVRGAAFGTACAASCGVVSGQQKPESLSVCAAGCSCRGVRLKAGKVSRYIPGRRNIRASLLREGVQPNDVLGLPEQSPLLLAVLDAAAKAFFGTSDFKAY